MEKQTFLTYTLSFILISISGFSIFFAQNGRINPQEYNDDLISSLIKKCDDAKLNKNQAKEKCYSERFTEIAYKHDAAYAFETLFALQNQDSDAEGCHFIAHGIGYGTYKRNPEKWQEYINTLNPSCTYGAIHGVIEKYIGSLGTGFTKEIITTICGEYPRGSCNHIVGHLILVETEADINKALNFCNEFTDSVQRNNCLSGIFMEYQTAINLINHGLAPDSWLDWAGRIGELEKTCRSYDGEIASACWEEISHAADATFSDPVEVIEFCDSAHVTDGVKMCKRHAIGILALNPRYAGFESLSEICKIPQQDDHLFERDCYSYLLGATISSSPRKSADRAMKFCSSIPFEFQDFCFRQTGTMLHASRVFTDTELKTICRMAPSGFIQNCLTGFKFNAPIPNHELTE